MTADFILLKGKCLVKENGNNKNIIKLPVGNFGANNIGNNSCMLLTGDYVINAASDDGLGCFALVTNFS